MKKLLSVSIMAMLAVSPMMANADPVLTPAGGVQSSDGLTATAGPFYSLQDITNNDKKGVASAAYVKGAYNNAIRAINKVAETANAGQTAQEVKDAITAAAGNGLTGTNGVLNVGAGDGITVNADSVEVKKGDGLAINATSKALEVNKGDGLAINATSKALEINKGNGLAINETSKAVEVKAADTTINVSANGVKVGEITTDNVKSTAKATGGTGYEDTKLSTQGYVDKKVADLNMSNYKVKDVAANGDIALDSTTGEINLTTTAHNLLTGAVQDVSEGTTAGAISVDGQAVAVHGLATVATSGNFSDLNNKPTTVSGYGITDAYTKTEVDNKISTATTDMATGTGVEYTIEHAVYTTALTVPLYTEWGTTTTANTDTVTASTTAAATYATSGSGSL